MGIDCCDLTITVLSDPEMIKKRLKKRYTPEKIDEILKQQTDVIEEGIVVRNDGTIEELYTKLKNLFEEKNSQKQAWISIETSREIWEVIS